MLLVCRSPRLPAHQTLLNSVKLQTFMCPRNTVRPNPPPGSKSQTQKDNLRVHTELLVGTYPILQGLGTEPAHQSLGQDGCKAVPGVPSLAPFWVLLEQKGGPEKPCLLPIIGKCSPDGCSATLKINVFTTLDPSRADECLLQGPEISHSGFCLDGWYPFHLLEREPPHQPWGLPPALAQGSSSEESACLSPGLVRNVPREGPVWSTLLLTQLRSGVATVHERPTPCPSHPASSCRVREHGLLSVSAPHFLLEEAGEQSLVFQSPPGSGLSTDRGVGASCAPTRFLISQPPLAARLDGRMGPVGRPRSQRKEQAGAEAGDGDLDGLESRTAVGTLIDDAGVGAQRRQGSGELC
ncbi:hypothetical protein MJT46_013661 [Ovis ammon polii x Ovis aries]|nr:hypothetical protein MJT46_013661 [Ovis ammon polii x Ovis aries]